MAAAGFANENDAAEGQRAMNVLHEVARATGAFVLGLDHFGKDGTRGTRGSSAKESSADVVLALLGDRGEDGAITDTRMAVRKLRAGSTGIETQFEPKVVSMGVDEDGDPMTTVVVDWGEEGSYVRPQKPKKETKTRAMMREAIETIGGLPAPREKVREAFAAL